jgi:hypothetical protein
MMWHSGALPGEKDYDLRTASVPQRRIYFSVRASDNRVVSVMYWKLGDYRHPASRSSRHPSWLKPTLRKSIVFRWRMVREPFGAEQ